MYEPGSILPDPGNAQRSPLDRLSESLPGNVGAAMFDCTPDGILIDANGNYFDIERGAGYGHGELARKLVAAIAPGAESIAASFVLELLGNPRHFHVRFAPVSTQGRNEMKLAGIMRDITVHTDNVRGTVDDGWRDDERVRVNSDWYWETDAHGLLTSVSRSVELLVGQPGGGLLGRPLSVVGAMLRGDNGEMPMELAAANGSSFRDQLMTVQTSAGTKLYRLAGVAVWDSEGVGSGYRGVASVVPDSARLIERMRSELGRTAKQHFLSAMSHELRTPLNAIIGFAEAMNHEVHGSLKPQYVEYAGDIASAGRHLLGLIQDLLDISSLDSGGVDLECETFNLSELVDQARAMVTMKAAARNIDIQGVMLDYPVPVRADRRRTLQILVNLLTNAVKFTPEGGMVGAQMAPSSDPHEVGVIIWDTGPGIDPRDHGRVFEKFEQLSGSPHVATAEGTGLGLHISRRLASLMGGDLTLTSKLGEGARFALILPAAD